MRNLLSDCRLEIVNIAGESQQLLHARYMSFLQFGGLSFMCDAEVGAMSETRSIRNCKAHKGQKHHADITDIKVRMFFFPERRRGDY